jgi:predicted DNA-binding transcriptional regulator YafY
MDAQTVQINYTNWKGETAVRTIKPEKIWFGKTEWHKEEQWLLSAFDLEKQEHRNFAMKDILSWSTAAK